MKRRDKGYAVGVACRVHLLGEGTKVPGVDDVATDLNGLDVLHLRDFLVLADRGVVHSHLARVLGLVELDHARRLLDRDAGHFKLVLLVTISANGYNAVHNLVSLHRLRVKRGEKEHLLIVEFVGKDVNRRHPTIHTSIHL